MHNVACRMERGTIFLRSTKYNPQDRGTPTISNEGKKLRKTNYLVHRFCLVFLHSIATTHSIAANRIIPAPRKHLWGRRGNCWQRKLQRDQLLPLEPRSSCLSWISCRQRNHKVMSLTPLFRSLQLH